jgi:glycosyltransferase involved in cell wall biosynthesis
MSITKVSIIVPCYNQAQFLDECLQSVLGQTFTDWECIIVNDGSPDNTEEVSQKWVNKDIRFKYLLKTNGGIISARNEGIRIALGEYILLLDADDYIAPSFISKTLILIESDNNIKGVSTGIKNFGTESGEHISNSGTVVDLLHCNFTICTTLFRKAAITDIGYFDEAFEEGYEDWEFWIRLLKNGGTINIIPECLFFYRKKNNSRVVEALSFHDKIYKQIIEKHLDLYKKHLLEVLLLKEKDLSYYIKEYYKSNRLLKGYSKSRYFKITNYFRSIVRK